MRTILLLLLICGQTAFAQKIRFTNPNNEWRSRGQTGTLIKYCTFDAWYHYGADTAMNGHTYKRLIRTMNYQPALTSTGCAGISGDYPFYVREDTAAGNLFFCTAYDSIEQTLFRYSLQPGDTFHVYGTADSVLGVDSTLINGTWHKLWYVLSGGGNNQNYVMVEGLGCTNSPLYRAYMNGCTWGYTEKLLCFSNNGVTPTIHAAYRDCFTTADSFVNSPGCAALSITSTAVSKPLSIAPNPARQSITITTTDAGTIAVTDMTGKNMYTSSISAGAMKLNTGLWPAGVYILLFLKEGQVLQRERLTVSE